MKEIRSFSDLETELIYKGIRSKKLPFEIQKIARRKLRMIASAMEIGDLKIPPGNHLEKLLGNLDRYYSIRINDKWRIIFKLENGGAENVKITDYH